MRMLIAGLLLVGIALAAALYGHRQAAASNPWLTPLPTQVGCAQLPGGEPSACDLLALPVGGAAVHAGVLVLRGKVRMTMSGARADRGTDDGRCASSLYLEARFRNLTDHDVQLPPDGVNVIGSHSVYPPTAYFYPGNWGNAGEWQSTDFYGSIEHPTTLHAGEGLDIWTTYGLPVQAGMRFRAGWVSPWPEYLDPNHVTIPPAEAVYRMASNGTTGCNPVRAGSVSEAKGEYR